ncbi:MAG: hypothetical protein ACLRPV_06125 [Lacrimispora saccharolytica]
MAYNFYGEITYEELIKILQNISFFYVTLSNFNRIT